MPPVLPGIALGRLLREDAVGACWAAATPDGPRTLRALREEHLEREDARLLFQEEARRLRGLAGPGLVRALRSEPHAAWPWMLTESIDAPDLETVVAQEGPLPPQAALALLAVAAQGLATLEQRGQVHVAPVPARLLRLASGWAWLTFRDVCAADEAGLFKGKRPAGARHAPPEADAGHAEPLRAKPWAAWALGGVLRVALGLGPARDESGAPAPWPADLPAAVRGPLARLLDPSPLTRAAGAQAALALLAGPSSAPARPAAAPAPRFVAPVPKHKRPPA